MPGRPIWRGHLRLALVSCPIALYTARHERAQIHFHFINPETGHRVRMITQDAETEQELSRRDLVKGYEFKKDHYLILSDEDFEAVRIESSATMNVDKFVPVDAIDPIYFENSYYVVPDGDAGEDVYVVLREAIANTKRMALSRIVISRRERAVALMPMGRGLVAHTLYDERDLQESAGLFDAIPDLRPDPEMVKLATQLVDRQAGTYDPSDVEDRYEARLRELIEAKLKGEGLDPDPEPAEDSNNVVDLMAALKKSLQTSANSARAPAASAKTAAKPESAAKPAAAKSKAPAKKAPPAKKAAPPPVAASRAKPAAARKRA